jgi:anti-sigma factor RsiW
MILTCREVYGFLDQFLDDALDALTRQSFAKHLERCASCRKYLTSYQTTLKVAHASEAADMPTEGAAPEALVQAILAARAAAFSKQPPE